MVDTLHVAVRPLPLALGIGALIALPPALAWIDQSFYVLLATRILIYGLIATSLNLLIGYGGMVSFGHAAFVGAGAYALAALMQAGIMSAWIAWPVAVLAGAALALLVGWVSLRTAGVYFIMITLAFAQMAYYAVISLRLLGGDDGLNLPHRSALGFGIDLRSDATFYYATLVALLIALGLFLRLINGPLGRALQGIRDNEARMEAIGFPTFRIKLVGFVIAGAAAGLGGALLANLNGLVSPSLMHWTQSGTLMIMVILGGAGYPLGGLIGACVLVVLEEVLREYTIHWQLGVGAVLLAIVLFAEHGLAGLMRRQRAP